MSFLQQLPDELWLQIFTSTFTESKALYQLGKVCKKWLMWWQDSVQVLTCEMPADKGYLARFRNASQLTLGNAGYLQGIYGRWLLACPPSVRTLCTAYIPESGYQQWEACGLAPQIRHLVLMRDSCMKTTTLDGFTCLETLAINCNECVASPKSLAQLTGLITLSLSTSRSITTRFPASSLASLTQLRHLEYISRLSVQMFIDYSFLSHMTRLESLDLSTTETTISYLNQPPHYKEMARQLEAVTKMSRLTRLVLRGNQPFPLGAIRHHTQLTHLDVSDRSLGDGDLIILKGLKNLTFLKTDPPYQPFFK
jgi:hypothetical protein